MPGAGIEPARGFPQGIFLPLQLSLLQADAMHLWSGLYLCHPVNARRGHGLGRGRQVSTLSLVGHMRRPKYSAEQAQVCLSPVAMQPYRLAGLPIPLELDHINGNNGDNRLENLRLLCPNCHALTPTYRSKRRTKA